MPAVQAMLGQPIIATSMNGIRIGFPGAEQVTSMILRFMEWIALKCRRISISLWQLTVFLLLKGSRTPKDPIPGSYFDPEKYMTATLKMFKAVKQNYCSKFQLIHDVHERLAPNQALRFAKKAEKYDLYFLEDNILSPDQNELLR